MKNEYGNDKVDENMENEDIRSSFHEAAYDGDIDTAQSLVSKGVDVNTKDKGGDTPCHIAAFGGHVEIVKFFVSIGADVNAKDKNGNTPLHLAASEGHFEVVKFLVSEGANVKAKNFDRKIPLDLANKWWKMTVVKCLSQPSSWKEQQHPTRKRLGRSDQKMLRNAVRSLLSDASGAMDVSSIIQSLNDLYQNQQFSAQQVLTMIRSLVKQSDDIFLWDRGKVYIHRTNMNYQAPFLEILEDNVIQALQSNAGNSLALYGIYEKYHDACSSAGIPSAVALHSCLKVRSHPSISFVNSPRVCQPGNERGRDYIVVLEKWATNQQKIFSKEAMFHFVHRMGITKKRFPLLFGCLKSVIRYDNKLFVHLDSLNWTSNRQSDLETVALTYWKECRTRGALFARTDQLLEERASNMPELPSFVEWNSTLVCSLLSRSENIEIYGNTHLCYGFKSEPSFLPWGGVVEQVLRTQYGGGARLREFSDYLRDELRLIRKCLTLTMRVQCPNIHFTKYEISLIAGGHDAS